MYENHRDSFKDHPLDDDRREDQARRWRRSEERYRREAQGDARDEDRYDRNRDFGYGRAFRDDDYAPRGNGWRGSPAGRTDSQPVHWHEREHELRSGHPYQGSYGGTGDSSYFTGGQGSWAVGAPQVPSPYYGGPQHFGADYRAHGYDAAREHDRGFWDRASDEVASWFGDDDAARRREVDHRGRGPQNYVRSDERISEDANDKLTDDWQVDASRVTVAVKDGEITLNGFVTSRAAKRRAEDVVDRISGVKHVQNNLRVHSAESGTAYTGNRATTGTSPAEGGTLGQARSESARQTDKI